MPHTQSTKVTLWGLPILHPILVQLSHETAFEYTSIFIYKPDGSLAEVYDNGALISQPLYTDAIGHWEAPNMKVLDNGTYDVEFVYDGQTFEPTIFLATSNGDANAYRNLGLVYKNIDNIFPLWYNKFVVCIN